MTQDEPEEKLVCSICGQARKEHQLVRLQGHAYCIFCRDVLEDWATQIGYDREALINRLDSILRDMLTEKDPKAETE